MEMAKRNFTHVAFSLWCGKVGGYSESYYEFTQLHISLSARRRLYQQRKANYGRWFMIVAAFNSQLFLCFCCFCIYVYLFFVWWESCAFLVKTCLRSLWTGQLYLWFTIQKTYPATVNNSSIFLCTLKYAGYSLMWALFWQGNCYELNGCLSAVGLRHTIYRHIDG